ncbi:MAG: ORF6N domain-containing protein [Candidatus Moranbacteria bacterium]|nr:ORF6N domain-containing protein [Candidatus Moranbacteria bacterium]
MKAKTQIPQELIENKIYFIRGKKVMLDSDLAILYRVETKTFNRAVKRNLERFPEEFMFQLSKEEYASLRYQFGTLKRGQHSKYSSYVFTEYGVAMLSSVLSSKRSIQVNIQIIKTFVRLREIVISNHKLRLKIESMEKKYDKKFVAVFDAIRRLLDAHRKEPAKIIGFRDRKKK